MIRPRDVDALLELAERCEKATGRDRDLDNAIIDAFGWRNDFGTPIPPGFVGVPDYSGSIDHALTLVPDAMRWCVDTCDGRPRSFVETRLPYDGQPFWGNASTPALALCAAALRARSAQS